MVLDKLNINHVKYSLSDSCSRKVSRCELITSERVSIVTMEDVMGYGERNGIDVKAWLGGQKDFFDMLTADYILWNVDRHYGNWGVYMNPDTGKILGLHPLFDHNLCLFREEGIIYSHIIPTKTLEQVARFAKSKHTVNMVNLLNWLSERKTKALFKEYLRGLTEYNELKRRAYKYMRWSV